MADYLRRIVRAIRVRWLLWRLERRLRDHRRREARRMLGMEADE